MAELQMRSRAGWHHHMAMAMLREDIVWSLTIT